LPAIIEHGGGCASGGEAGTVVELPAASRVQKILKDSIKFMAGKNCNNGKK
jgi:hypothetical protein